MKIHLVGFINLIFRVNDVKSIKTPLSAGLISKQSIDVVNIRQKDYIKIAWRQDACSLKNALLIY